MTNWRNDQRAIDAALADTDAKNPIAVEIAAAIGAFADRIAAQAQQTGEFPTELLLLLPDTAFDETVIRLTLQTIADETGLRISIHWINEEDTT